MSTVMSSDHAVMSRLTRELPSKSAKMRALARAGYGRGDIARFLGTNYQFVRNVLLREEARLAQEAASVPAPVTQPTMLDEGDCKVRVGPEGRIVLPAAARQALALKEGDVLFVSTEEGEVHLMTKLAAVRRVQAMVRKFVPAGVSLVDELLDDRRREVERERNDG